MIDWFNRNNDNFTLANDDLKLGWDTVLTSQYSKYLYSQSIVSSLLNDNNLLIEELKILVNKISGEIKQVFINNEGNDSFTDGNIIVVSPVKANETYEDAFDRMDVILGLTLHELSHCMYTDFKFVEANIQNINPIVKFLHNVIEDELIERKLGSNFPGYINFISKVKYLYFNKLGLDFKEKEQINELDTILNIFLYIIRYPSKLDDIPEYVMVPVDSLFNDIYKIMKDQNCFVVDDKNITVKALNSAILIEKLLRERYAEDYSEMESLAEKYGSAIKKQKKLADNIDAASESPDFMAKHNKSMQQLHKERKQFILNNNGCNLIGFEKTAHNNINRYNRIYKIIQPYISKIRSIMFNPKFKEVLVKEDYKRNGTLDTNHLVDALQNVQTVYKRNVIKREVVQSKMALVILMDESGSMSKDNFFVTSLAVLLYEVYSKYPYIELYIYGHGDHLYTYIDKNHKSKYAIANSTPQGSQNDFEAYKYVIEHVRKQTSLPTAMINITDSCYCASQGIPELFKEYRKKQWNFYLMCINNTVMENKFENKLIETNNNIYGENFWFISKHRHDYEEVIKEFNRIVKKHLKF